MNKLDSLDRIVRIAKDFYQYADKSFERLVLESGYLLFFDSISETDIYNNLIFCSDCSEWWLKWSENKRTDGGWYFIKKEFDAFEVGLAELQNSLDVQYFDEVNLACAFFVKKELEQLRLYGEKSNN